MALKLANNAVGQIADNITTSETSIILKPGQGQNFPALGAGDWFPLTVLRPDGAFEIMRCTARSGDTLTVLRGQENTSPISFLLNDRVELRMTAGVLATYFPNTGGTLNGNLAVQGDVSLIRPDAPTTGALFLGNSGNNYLYFNGTQYVMPGADLLVNGSKVWTASTLNPAAYLPLTGGTMTGQLTISNTSPQITLNDTDWGNRYLHCNSGQVGFLNSSGGWACYSSDDGTFVATGNIGAYSDRKFKRDITEIDEALALVEKLHGIRYVDNRSDKPKIGVIAQEVQEVFPEAVGESPDGLYVDYACLVGPLIEAVKVLAGRVRALEG